MPRIVHAVFSIEQRVTLVVLPIIAAEAWFAKLVCRHRTLVMMTSLFMALFFAIGDRISSGYPGYLTRPAASDVPQSRDRLASHGICIRSETGPCSPAPRKTGSTLSNPPTTSCIITQRKLISQTRPRPACQSGSPTAQGGGSQSQTVELSLNTVQRRAARKVCDASCCASMVVLSQYLVCRWMPSLLNSTGLGLKHRRTCPGKLRTGRLLKLRRKGMSAEQSVGRQHTAVTSTSHARPQLGMTRE